MGAGDGNEAVEFDVMGRSDGGDDDVACGNQSFCQLLLSDHGEMDLEPGFRFTPPPCCSTSPGLLCFGSTVEGEQQQEEDLLFRERLQPSKRKKRLSDRVQKKPSSSNKGRKEKKLGEGVAALQQLVSPFGKTDTASVLHEAMGYIKFLQEQVQVLCSPYLQHHHHPPPDDDDRGDVEEEAREGGDLRSRGLCLVPAACCIHVQGSGIGADFWSPSTRR